MVGLMLVGVLLTALSACATAPDFLTVDRDAYGRPVPEPAS